MKKRSLPTESTTVEPATSSTERNPWEGIAALGVMILVAGLVSQLPILAVAGGVIALGFALLAVIRHRQRGQPWVENDGVTYPNGETLPFSEFERVTILEKNDGVEGAMIEGHRRSGGRAVVASTSAEDMQRVREIFPDAAQGFATTGSLSWIRVALLLSAGAVWWFSHEKFRLPFFFIIAVPQMFKVRKNGRVIVHRDGIEIRALYRGVFIPLSGVLIEPSVGEGASAFSVRIVSADSSKPDAAPKTRNITFLNEASREAFVAAIEARRSKSTTPSRVQELSTLSEEALATRLALRPQSEYRDTSLMTEDLAALAEHPLVPVRIRVAATKSLMIQNPEVARQLEPKLRVSVDEELRELGEEMSEGRRKKRVP